MNMFDLPTLPLPQELTESRIMMAFQLFYEIIEQSDQEPMDRIQELERRKSEIEAEIAKVELGQIKVRE